MSLVVRGETLNWARKRASGQAGQWEGELVPDKGELSASRKRWSRLGSRHSGRTAIKLRNMRTASDIIIDKLDDLTSSVDFIKSKMMRDECDQMSKEMKQDQEDELAGGQSKWACHEHVVFAKGIIDDPAGDCLKWDTVFHASGYADEFGSKEKFVEQRDDDIALAGSFTKACAVWLSAKNEGRRCRARADGRRGKGVIAS